MSLNRSGGRKSVADVSRQLLEQAYPDQNSAWIHRQTNEAVQQIHQAVSARQKRVLTCTVRTRDPAIVAAHIQNTGDCAVRPGDYLEPLTLRFPDRIVVGVDMAESRPQWLSNCVSAALDLGVGPDRIVLPAIALEPGHSFTLITTLSGATHVIDVNGRLRDGWIAVETPRRRSNGVLRLGVMTLIAVAALAVLLLLQ